MYQSNISHTIDFLSFLAGWKEVINNCLVEAHKVGMSLAGVHFTLKTL